MSDKELQGGNATGKYGGKKHKKHQDGGEGEEKMMGGRKKSYEHQDGGEGEEKTMGGNPKMNGGYLCEDGTVVDDPSKCPQPPSGGRRRHRKSRKARKSRKSRKGRKSRKH